MGPPAACKWHVQRVSAWSSTHMRRGGPDTHAALVSLASLRAEKEEDQGQKGRRKRHKVRGLGCRPQDPRGPGGEPSPPPFPFPFPCPASHPPRARALRQAGLPLLRMTLVSMSCQCPCCGSPIAGWYPVLDTKSRSCSLHHAHLPSRRHLFRLPRPRSTRSLCERLHTVSISLL